MAKQDVTVLLWYDDQWNDHTSDVLVDDQITITRGKADETQQPAPATATLTFKGFKFNPRNPNSTLHGKIGRNTPLEILVDDTVRFAGEVASWTPLPALSGKDSQRRVKVQATGITRRLGQGADPLRDTVHRFALQNGAVGYWPLSDPQGAREALSAIQGAPLRFVSFTASENFVNAYPQFSQGFLGPWLPPCIKAGGDSGWSGGQLRGRVSNTATVSGYAVDMLYRAEAGQESTDLPTNVAMSVISTQSTRWRLLIPSDGGATTVRVQQSDDDGVVDNFDDVAAATLFDGETHHVRLHITEASGNNANWFVQIDGVAVDSGTFDIGVASIGGPAGAAVDWFSDGSVSPREVAPVHFGHLTVWSGTVPSLSDTAAAYFGYQGEHAGRRIERLCDEEGIPFVGDLAHDMDNTLPMGPQYPDTLLGLLHECADVDRGLLIDGANTLNDSPAIDYRPHRELYNQFTPLQANWEVGSIAPPLEPRIDDQLTRNDVTATRRDGGSARAVDEDGPLGVATVGRYTEGVTVNVMSDGMLGDQAGWRLNIGTVDDVRYPQITIDLDANPTLATAVSLVVEGDRILLTALPDDISPDFVSLIVLGWTETIGSHRRLITYNCVPASAYQIAEVEHANFGVIGSDSATLAEDLDADEIGITFNCGAGPDWADETDPGWEPFDIVIGGERMTVTAVSGAVGTFPNRTQSMNVTRSVNGVVKTHPTGSPIRFFNRAHIGL